MMNNALKISLLALIGVSCGHNHPAITIKATPPCSTPQWLPLGQGLDGEPFMQSMLVYKGELYVAGRFKYTANQRLRNIARWNGTRWDSVGSGLNEYSDALCIYNNELYVSGEFKEAGGKPAHKIAKWNGNRWDSVGSGSNWGASTMAAFNGKLYVGGPFDVLGNKPVYGLGVWSGNTWSPMKEELVGNYTVCETGSCAGKIVLCLPCVYSLLAYNGCLYVGGNFKKAGKLVVNNIAKWNDTTWTTIGHGLNDSNSVVEGMAVYNGKLYVAGDFTKIDGKTMNNIAMWDGYNWQPLDSGIRGEPYDTHIKSMLVFNGELYVAGVFTKAGDKYVKCNLAKWNGKEWKSVGDSTFSLWDGHGHIETIATYRDELYAGGLFEKAGGHVVNNIAKWACIDTTLTESKH
jgi:hypothetical protein